MMMAMVMAVRPSGLDRIEGDSRSARAGSIGLAPEAMVMALPRAGLIGLASEAMMIRSGRAGSIGLRVTVDPLEPARSDWLPRMLTSMLTVDPLEPARSN